MRAITLLSLSLLTGCASSPDGPKQPPCGVSPSSYYNWTVARDQGLDQEMVIDKIRITETAGQAISIMTNEPLAKRQARAADIAAQYAAAKWIYAHPKLTPLQVQEAATAADCAG